MTSRQTRVVIGSVLVALIVGLLALDAWLSSRVAGTLVLSLLGVAGYLELQRMVRGFLSTSDSAQAPGRADSHSTDSHSTDSHSADSHSADSHSADSHSADVHERSASWGRGESWIAFTGLLACLWFLGVAWWESAQAALPFGAEIAGLVGFVLISFLGTVFQRRHLESFRPLPQITLGVLLFGLFYSYVIRIYHLPEGTLIGAVFVLGVKGTDIVAYLVGSAIGRHRFVAVSPKKSAEGYVAALIFAAAWFGGAGAYRPDVFFDWSSGIAFGILLGVTSALGDLAESLLKRSYRVKDSGALLPEFGGALDMIDSFLFSGFVFWQIVRETPWN